MPLLKFGAGQSMISSEKEITMTAQPNVIPMQPDNPSLSRLRDLVEQQWQTHGPESAIDGLRLTRALAIMKSRLPNRRYLGPLQYDAERGLIKSPDGATGLQGAGQA